MARKKTVVEPENLLYKVTSNGNSYVRLGNKMIVFDENNQAIVSKEDFEKLKELGVLL